MDYKACKTPDFSGYVSKCELLRLLIHITVMHTHNARDDHTLSLDLLSRSIILPWALHW